MKKSAKNSRTKPYISTSASGLRNRWVRGSWVALEYLGREQLRVPDQPDDIVVAGENPHLVLGVPVNWVLRSKAAEVAIGIGDDVRSEQVVVDRGCHTCLSSLSLPGARSGEAPLGLGVQCRRQRPFPQGIDVVLKMRRVDRPHDVRGHARMGEGEAKDELHRGHTPEQVVESCLLPALPLHALVPSTGPRPLGSPAPDDDARSRAGRLRDDRFVLPLYRRVRDLEHIEHAHRDVIREVRQRGRHADEPHLARPLERQYRLEGVVLLQGLFGRRGVELDYIEVIRLHSGEALFDTRDDVVAREYVRVPLPSWRRGRTDHTAAFASQVVLRAPVRNVAPNALLAESVVD